MVTIVIYTLSFVIVLNTVMNIYDIIEIFIFININHFDWLNLEGEGQDKEGLENRYNHASTRHWTIKVINQNYVQSVVAWVEKWENQMSYKQMHKEMRWK